MKKNRRSMITGVKQAAAAGLVLAVLASVVSCGFVGKQTTGGQTYTLVYTPDADLDEATAEQDRAVIEERISLLDSNLKCTETDGYGLNIETGTDFAGFSNLEELKIWLFMKKLELLIGNQEIGNFAANGNVQTIELCGEEDSRELKITLTSQTIEQCNEAEVDLTQLRATFVSRSQDGNNVYYTSYYGQQDRESGDLVFEITEDETEDLERYLAVYPVDSLSAALNCTITSEVDWLDSASSDNSGNNQFLPDSKGVPEGYIGLYYKNYNRRYTSDERQNLIASFQEELDTTGVSYALGYDFDGMFVAAVPEDANLAAIAPMMGGSHGLYVLLGDAYIYYASDQVIVSDKGLTILPDEEDAATVELFEERYPDKPLILSTTMEASHEVARISDTDGDGSVLVFDRYPDGMEWITDFFSVMNIWNEEISYGMGYLE